MSSESDGTGKADNLEVIRKLLQKLEEAAAVEGSRSPATSNGPARSSAEAARQASPRAKPPVLESKPLVVTEPSPGRELSSLQRGATPARIPTNPPPAVLTQERSLGPSGGLTPVSRRSISRSPVVAVTAFALGAVSAAALVTYFEPFRWLFPTSSQLGTSAPVEIATAPPAAAPTALPEASTPPVVVAEAIITPPAAVAPSPNPPEPQSNQRSQDTSEPKVERSAGTAEPPAAPQASERQTATAAPEIRPEAKAAVATPAVPVRLPESESIQTPPSSTQSAAVAPLATVIQGPNSNANAMAPASPALIALSAVRRIDGKPGTRQPFPLRLEPMPREDQQLLVILRAVPEWVTLSKGSAIDTELWLIPAHTVSDLEIEFAADAQGSAELRVELATLDGRLIARAPTTLSVTRLAPQAPPPLANLSAGPLDGLAILHLLARGDSLLDTGDFDAARQLYRAAAEAGSAGAALKLGQTYDPAEVDRLGMTRKVADEALARRWYELARSLGSSMASDRLSTLGRQ